MSQRLAVGTSKATTNTTADTTSLLEADNLSGYQVKQLHIILAGTSHTLANVTRITLRAESRPFYDADPWAFRALYGYLGKKAEWATTAVRFTFPFDLMGAAPPPGRLRFDFTKNATPQTGSITTAYTIGNSPQRGYHMFTATTLGVPASGSNRPFTFQAPVPGAVLLGFAIEDVANITLLRIYAEGAMILDCSSYLALTEYNEQERGATAVAELYIPVRALPQSRSGYQLEISVGASWAGEANEIVPLWWIPFGQE